MAAPGGKMPHVVATTAAPRDAFVALPKPLAQALHGQVRAPQGRARPRESARARSGGRAGGRTSARAGAAGADANARRSGCEGFGRTAAAAARGARRAAALTRARAILRVGRDDRRDGHRSRSPACRGRAALAATRRPADARPAPPPRPVFGYAPPTAALPRCPAPAHPPPLPPAPNAPTFLPTRCLRANSLAGVRWQAEAALGARPDGRHGPRPAPQGVGLRLGRWRVARCYLRRGSLRGRRGGGDHRRCPLCRARGRMPSGAVRRRRARLGRRLGGARAERRLRGGTAAAAGWRRRRGAALPRLDSRAERAHAQARQCCARPHGAAHRRIGGRDRAQDQAAGSQG